MTALNPYAGVFARRWLKGDVHTHTTRSDGGATPDDVMQRLRECRFDFAEA